MKTTNYPNREHQNADEAARRRAFKCLDTIEADVTIIRRRLGNQLSSNVDASDARGMAEQVGHLTEHLSALMTLREVREWHTADQAEQPPLSFNYVGHEHDHEHPGGAEHDHAHAGGIKHSHRHEHKAGEENHTRHLMLGVPGLAAVVRPLGRDSGPSS